MIPIGRALAAVRARIAVLRRKPAPAPDHVADGLLAVFNSRRKLEADVDAALRKALSK